jgi:fructokinase
VGVTDDRIAVGIDLGGTKIEGVVARPAPDGLDVLERVRVETHQSEGYDAIVARVASTISNLVAEATGSVAIGVGMPGGTERRTGHVKNSNTVCLNGRPFRADLERAVGASIVFENDANCFALAETLSGAARDHAGGVVFGVIMGTGVGGGLVLSGSIWPGLQGIAGEWGHHGVHASALDARPCYCGRRGCLETYLSGPAVERDYAARAGATASLPEIARARGSDPHAAASLETMLDAFGRGLANLIDIVDPSAIVLGGGVSNLSMFYDEGRARVARYVFNDELATPILKHALGDSAGVLGAAWLALASGARLV